MSSVDQCWLCRPKDRQVYRLLVWESRTVEDEATYSDIPSNSTVSFWKGSCIPRTPATSSFRNVSFEALSKMALIFTHRDSS